MRILVSNKGRKEFQELQNEWDSIKDEKFQEKQKIFDEITKKMKKKKLNDRSEKASYNKYINSKKFGNKDDKLSTLPHSLSGTSNYFNTQTNFQTTNYINYTNYDNNQMTEETVLKEEEIKVKQKKPQLPKSISEKYNMDRAHQEDSIITPTLPVELTTSRKMFNKDGSKKRFINVKDILNSNTIEKLKQQKLRAKKVKELNTVINNSNIRTNYAEKDVLDELYEKLDVDIDVNKINLIKYLHGKEQVSEKFIKQFETFSNEKLNKLNKICQIITYRNELQKVDKDLIQERLKMELNKVKMNYKSLIDDVENGIFFSNAILKPYKNKIDKATIYGDLFRETKKHWEKINAERLQRTKYRSGLYSGENTTYGVFIPDTSRLPKIDNTKFESIKTGNNYFNETANQFGSNPQLSKKTTANNIVTGGFATTANFFK